MENCPLKPSPLYEDSELAYLKTHTVSFEELYPDGPPAVPEEGPAEGAPEDGSGGGPASAEGDGDAMTEDGST